MSVLKPCVLWSSSNSLPLNIVWHKLSRAKMTQRLCYCKGFYLKKALHSILVTEYPILLSAFNSQRVKTNPLHPYSTQTSFQCFVEYMQAHMQWVFTGAFFQLQQLAVDLLSCTSLWHAAVKLRNSRGLYSIHTLQVGQWFSHGVGTTRKLSVIWQYAILFIP